MNSWWDIAITQVNQHCMIFLLYSVLRCFLSSFSDNYLMSWRLNRLKMMKHFILLVPQSSKWANIIKGTVYHFQTTPSQHGFTWLTLHFLCWALHMKRSPHRMIPWYVDAVVLINLDSRRVSQGVPGKQELKWRTQVVWSD